VDINVSVENVNLTDVVEQYGDRTLGDRIADELVAQFAKSDLYRGLAERVRTIRDEEIRAQLTPVLAEAINTPIVKTNTYGEATGGSTTLRELIVKEAREHLAHRDQSYNARDTRTVLQQMIDAAIQSAFKAELADAVKEAREAVVTGLGTTVAEMVADTVRQALAKR